MYNLQKIESECKDICNSVGITLNIPVHINGRMTRTLGMLKFTSFKDNCTPTSLEFSKSMIETCDDKSIHSVIQHEVAHYIAMVRSEGKDHGHDKYFKAICAEIGCDNDKTKTKVNRIRDNGYKYDVWCSHCDKAVYHYARRNPKFDNIERCTCGVCGNKTLSIMQNW